MFICVFFYKILFNHFMFDFSRYLVLRTSSKKQRTWFKTDFVGFNLSFYDDLTGIDIESEPSFIPSKVI